METLLVSGSSSQRTPENEEQLLYLQGETSSPHPELKDTIF